MSTSMRELRIAASRYGVRSLLTIGNPKTAKGEGSGYYTAVLHLAPFTLAGCGNVCSGASAECVSL